MTEAELTRDCIRRLNRLPGCFAAKTHGSQYQRKGLPDIVGCYHSEFFGIEMKLPGREKKVTAIQAAVLDKIRKAGGRAGVATSYAGCLEILQEKR